MPDKPNIGRIKDGKLVRGAGAVVYRVDWIAEAFSHAADQPSVSQCAACNISVAVVFSVVPPSLLEIKSACTE